MRDMEGGPVVLSRRHEPTAAVRTVTFDDVASGDEDSDAEFEFPFVSREPGAGPAADELFAGGRVRAFYPVFGRVLDEAAPAPAPAPAPAHQRPRLGRLFQLEQARTSSTSSTSSSSSAADTGTAAGLDCASPESYCLWTPGSAASSPSRPPRKSGSTGSAARWRRIGELVVGRSHSDGKEKFLFLSAPSSPARDRERDLSSSPASSKKQPPPKGSKAAKASTGGRRTFLPYRQELGLFANLHGLSRSHHPC